MENQNSSNLPISQVLKFRILFPTVNTNIYKKWQVIFVWFILVLFEVKWISIKFYLVLFEVKWIWKSNTVFGQIDIIKTPKLDRT